ncbi:MAG: PEGA domain-containing protein, partial [Polyangiales bacterium]
TMRRRASGFVNIATPGGWADVIIGGRNVGRTPLRTRLPAGRRRVVLRPFGRGSVRRSVTVRPREATRLVVPVTAP